MLNLLSGSVRNCEGQSRRSFLRIGALSGVGLSLPTWLAARQAAAAQNKTVKDVNCILIWSLGGISHVDTFDPKPEAPVSVRGEFSAINTAVPGVRFGEVLPGMARALKQFAVLRGWNPQNASHSMADQWVMSGHRFNAALGYPTYGSVVSYQKGFKTAMPPFVQLGSNVSRLFGGGTAGVLGLEHNPFELLANPNAKKLSVRDITLPRGINSGRLSRRQKMLAKIDALQKQTDLQPDAFHALDEHYKAALNMITAPETRKAFAIEEEKPALRDKYGRTTFGQSCLLARRLIESGVRFVTVSSGGWDTHTNNFRTLKTSRLPPVDQGLPQLLADLQQRGMLDSTLVLWLSDFGRTPKVNSASGRDHWASAGFAVMAGAGTPGGSVLGATDPEGSTVVRNEYHSDDIGATVYRKLGIPAELTVRAPDGRPVRLNSGRVIREWV